MKTKNQTRNYLIQSITQYIMFFFLGAVTGYLWEVSLMLVLDGSFYNRGFLYGPWLPIYGVGAVLMLLVLRRFQCRPLLVFVFTAFPDSIVELCIGWLLDQFWGMRYWDYRGYPLQLNGYICLYSALAFGAAGVLLFPNASPGIASSQPSIAYISSFYFIRNHLDCFISGINFYCVEVLIQGDSVITWNGLASQHQSPSRKMLLIRFAFNC